jgi:hypothetical protein
MPHHRHPPQFEGPTRHDNNSHRDIRSSRHALNRQRKASSKYYRYRGVHPSWLGQPYLDVTHSPSQIYNQTWWLGSGPLIHPDLAKFSVKTWTKCDMYGEHDHDIWPLDRRHSKGKHIREQYSWKYGEKDLERRTRQIQRAIDFACADAEEMAREDDDIDTVYWESEAWLWREGVPEVRDQWGRGLQEEMDLTGERFRRYEGVEGVGEWLRGVEEALLDERRDDEYVVLDGWEENDDTFSLLSVDEDGDFEIILMDEETLD